MEQDRLEATVTHDPDGMWLSSHTRHHRVMPDGRYPTAERTCCSLCIYARSLSHRQISSLLDCHPTKGVDATDTASWRVPLQHNVWILTSESVVDSLDLRDHLDWLIERMFPHRDALLALQDRRGVTMSLRSVWWLSGKGLGGAGPTLWPRQMLKLAQLNLELMIEFSDYTVDDEVGRAAPSSVRDDLR